ncbi:ATP-binding protein [Gymnodinialimonas ceratoperidinii]|uniref:histidine kinase n=1 Tax=Gymnodinialimonas ceratoperidinii TaxID=2856823 RepID=A0A8F6TSY1_9RHOB|nr:ATP-binding protein [Gymnodinialimonas ceratoperidinii]QXT38366.1 PAS domain-containing protein [Gymnodinialimonas ceratoperidinii]
MTRDLIHSVINAVPDPMLFIGADGTIDDANPAALALLGDWIVGRNHGVVLRQPALLREIERVAAGGPDVEVRIERADQDRSTHYQVRISAVTGQSGRPMLLHFADITHLGEVQEMRRDFVANVSHELRTPLTSMMGFIETLKGPARGDPAAQDRFLGIMEEEALRMERLIADLLSLSKVEAVARMRPSDSVDLAGVLSSVIATLTPRAQDSATSIDLVQEAEPAVIQGDRDQLIQVFLNLTENALKYGGTGQTVTLRIARLPASGAQKDDLLVVDVMDEGEGIAPQHLPRLTERFYRIDSHRSREMGGTGLGLAIVKHIVARHRGRLKISSKEGQGSTFSVQFPVK